MEELKYKVEQLLSLPHSMSTLFLFMIIFSSCHKDVPGPTDDSNSSDTSKGIIVLDNYGKFGISGFELQIFEGDHTIDSLSNFTAIETVLTGSDGFAAIKTAPPFTVLGSKSGYAEIMTTVNSWSTSDSIILYSYKLGWIRLILHDSLPLNEYQYVITKFQNFFVLDPWSYTGFPPVEYYSSVYLSNIQGDTTLVIPTVGGKSMIAGFVASYSPFETPTAYKNLTTTWKDTVDVSFDY